MSRNRLVSCGRCAQASWLSQRLLSEFRALWQKSVPESGIILNRFRDDYPIMRGLAANIAAETIYLDYERVEFPIEIFH